MLSLSLLSFFVKGRRVNCACENMYTDSCVGFVCFFTWNHGQVTKGCFEKEQIEQCIATGIPDVFVKCCYTDYCNANLTLPEKPGQEL